MMLLASEQYKLPRNKLAKLKGKDSIKSGWKETSMKHKFQPKLKIDLEQYIDKSKSSSSISSLEIEGKNSPFHIASLSPSTSNCTLD